MTTTERILLIVGLGLGALLGLVLGPMYSRSEETTEAATGDYVTDGDLVVTTADGPMTPEQGHLYLNDDVTVSPATPVMTFDPYEPKFSGLTLSKPYTCLELKTDSGTWHLVAEDEWNELQAELDECRKAEDAPVLEAKPGYVLVRKEIWDILEPALKDLAEQAKETPTDEE